MKRKEKKRRAREAHQLDMIKRGFYIILSVAKDVYDARSSRSMTKELDDAFDKWNDDSRKVIKIN